ncbi:hypothetical protein OH492_13345 [Vibrio chagasii]|nr:hypothetical protein [Vibrio chagasii]
MISFIDHCDSGERWLAAKPIKRQIATRATRKGMIALLAGLLLFNPPQGIAGTVADTLDYLHSQLATNGLGLLANEKSISLI